MMACQEFTVLYTHQKTKKSKVWQDGILKSTVGGNKATLCDDKGQILDSIFVKSQGFQGPRQVEKRMTMEEPAVAISPPTKNSHSSFPSQFYISSPLFSVPYKKEETSLLPNFNRDTFVTNERDPESVASLAFAPYAEGHKVVPNRGCSIGSPDTENWKPEFQLNNGMVSPNCHVSNGGTTFQNIRSKAEIITLLNFKTALSREQKHSETPQGETHASLKNLPLTSMELECHPDGLTLPQSTDFLSDQKIAATSESTSKSNGETTKHTKQLNSERILQIKSRWDRYLPSRLAKEVPELNDAEHNDKNANNLQPVQKEENGINRSLYNKDHHNRITQASASLEIGISPISKSSSKTLPHSSVSAESNMSKGNEVASSSGSIHYSNGTNALKTLADGHSKSNQHTITDNLEFCHTLENESYPSLCSEQFSNGSVYGDLETLDKQFPEINFSLLDSLDFSDTEDGELHAKSILSQGSVYLKDETETPTGASVQKNCEISNVKNNVQTAFSQGGGVNYVSKSQPLHLCEEIPEDLEENDATLHFRNEPGHLEATTVDECVEINAISIQHICNLNSSDTFEEGNKKTVEVGADNSQLSCISNNMKSASTLLAFSEKDNSSNRSPQDISDEHYTAPKKSYDLDFRPVIHPLNCETSSDEVQMSKNEFKNEVGVLDSIYKFSQDKENNSIGVKPSVVDSISLPKIANDFNMFRSLTEHSTALESLQMIEQNTGILIERQTLTRKHESTGGLEALKKLAEAPCSEDVPIPSCLFSGVPEMNSSLNSGIEKPTAATGKVQHDQSPFGVTGSEPKPVEFQGYQVKGSAASEIMMRKPCSHLRWDSNGDMAKLERAAKDACFFSAQELSNTMLPGLMEPLALRKFPEDDLNKITTENFHNKFNFEEEANNTFLTFSVFSKPPNPVMTHSPSDLNLDISQCDSMEPNEMLSVQQIPSQSSDCHFPPSSRNEEITLDIQEPEFLMSRIVPEPVDNLKSFFGMEESRYPEEEDRFVSLSTLRIRTPVVTVPADEELPVAEIDSSMETCEQVQQSSGFPVVSLYSKSKMLMPEDRICETFVGKKCIGERQRVLTQSTFPHVSEQKRQSKWQKYQNTAHCDLRTQNSGEVAMTDDFQAESVLGMPLDDTGEWWSDAIHKSLPDFAHLQMIKSVLCKQQRNFSSQDSVSEEKKLSLHLNQIFSTEEAPKVLGQLNCHNTARHTKSISELFFPTAEMVNCTHVPKRQVYIPADFQSSAHYKQVFTAALIEHLNILLFELSQKLHKALGKVDISFYTSAKGGQGQTKDTSAPLCNHKLAAKLVMVKKEGRNKGRLFYTCDAPKADQCGFFKWLDDLNPGQMESRPSVVLHDTKSIGIYLRAQKISIYEECQLLVRKAFDLQRKQIGKLKKFNIANANFDCDSRSKLFLKLNQKEHSSVYSKDDLWVISKTLTFESLDTLIACSVFFGPSSSNEVELLPLSGYSPSNWRSNMLVHALLVCNASTELTTLRNIEENFSPATLPIMHHLLTKSFGDVTSDNRVNKRKFKPPAFNTNTVNCGLLSSEMVISLANKMIQTFQLNKDQAMALIQIGSMMTSQEVDSETGKQQALPITIIHGVFGSGKSYLLAVVILFLIQIFETSEAAGDKRSVPWKLLISSSTNVAVDRILLCLLDLGFEEFIRVGSVRKIAKPVLPYSLHAGSGPESEQLKELLALMKEDLTPAEKVYVRKTIDHHKLGTNKARLQQVRVVGATCAACPFPCMKNLKFPIVVLDECSQMTEPASLLPIARFDCEKLILVGDPKQLPPTIQGSESAHGNGLEQTLFDRLCLMGHQPILLRTQYRCHPAICAITNDLFYEGDLLNGISEMDRSPLVDWLPTLCFYNVNGLEQVERDNSFHNMAESYFIVKLIQSLIASGLEGSMTGVITLYKSQMSKICNLLAAIHSDASQIKAVQVSTVDAFQGAEKEIIVLSCVRTRQVGFIDSEKRVNVALTRGKRHLLIVGNLNCLRKNKLWGYIIQHCAGRKNGLQHVGQCEQQLTDILKSYLERKKEEEMHAHKEKSKLFSKKTKG
ncbi:protein ZGRF1 isoform X2 [Hemicordylus capensis]|uniref:protein ZGRF1 isoform X2 n=1 Tax=Hemicordylus capensis TaxID=884348 RepID=UPI00230305D5|nr:protein ZGRF1 isoform X2 [Hemicordylus capensis]